jgi:hypothetical protein
VYKTFTENALKGDEVALLRKRKEELEKERNVLRRDLNSSTPVTGKRIRAPSAPPTDKPKLSSSATDKPQSWFEKVEELSKDVKKLSQLPPSPAPTPLPPTLSPTQVPTPVPTPFKGPWFFNFQKHLDQSTADGGTSKVNTSTVTVKKKVLVIAPPAQKIILLPGQRGYSRTGSFPPLASGLHSLTFGGDRSVCYGLSAWVQTRFGGTVVAQYNSSSTHSKSLYIGRDGKVYFAIAGTPAVGSKSRVAEGHWHNIAVKFDCYKSKFDLFVDGTQQASQAMKPHHTPTDTPLFIGFTDPDFWEQNPSFPSARPDFSGVIARVLFWKGFVSKARLEKEIQSSHPGTSR